MPVLTRHAGTAALAASPCRGGPTTCWPGSRTPTGPPLWPARTRRPARSPTRSSTRRCRATRGSASGAAVPVPAGEQAGVDPAAGDTAARLAAGNAAYEERFGRVFLIRAAGRDAEAILAELDRRLGNDDATERAETVDNLRQIALLRLEALL